MGKNKKPVHPGKIIGDHVLPSLGLSVTKAAIDLNITRQSLHRVIRGEHKITTEMALRLGKLCNNDPGVWIKLQNQYDLWRLKRELKAELRNIPSYTLNFGLDS